MSNLAPPFPQLTRVTLRYKDCVLKLAVPKRESFLIGDIFLREEYPLTQLKGVFGKTTILDMGANVGLFAVYVALKSL